MGPAPDFMVPSPTFIYGVVWACDHRSIFILFKLANVVANDWYQYYQNVQIANTIIAIYNH